METIGIRFKTIRQNFKRNQSDFGQMLELTDDAISAIERNKSKPTFKTLEKLEELGVNSSWLITGKGNIFHQDSDKKELTLKRLLPSLSKISGMTEDEIKAFEEYLKNGKPNE